MNDRRKTRISKRLSLVLRHKPQSIGVQLDSAGWIDVSELLSALGAGGVAVTEAELLEVVATSPKQRFALSADSLRIRANQGHSIPVELGYEPHPPPPKLFHGTDEGAVESILRGGLEARGRHHVHLSEDIETATMVGSRRGRPVIFEIGASHMAETGAVFYVTPNRVWLTAAVPPTFLKLIRGRQE